MGIDPRNSFPVLISSGEGSERTPSESSASTLLRLAIALPASDSDDAPLSLGFHMLKLKKTSVPSHVRKVFWSEPSADARLMPSDQSAALSK